MAETNLERVFAAELWRVEGELLLGEAGRATNGTNTLAARAVGDSQHERGSAKAGGAGISRSLT